MNLARNDVLYMYYVHIRLASRLRAGCLMVGGMDGGGVYHGVLGGVDSPAQRIGDLR